MSRSISAFTVTELTEDLSACEMRSIDLANPAPGEVQVRVEAAAIGFPDLLMTRGGYQFKPPLPFVPANEGAGVITALGSDVTGWAIGDRVICNSRTGLLQQAANLEAAVLRPLPDHLSFERGAASTSAYLTAYVSLVRRGQLEPGGTLLVHGAAGGVGLAAVEMGKLLGARVIAAGSTEEKRAVAKSKGADEVIDSAPGFRDRVKELTGGKGADVIYDPVGGDVFNESLRCVAWGGRLLVVGFASGRIGQVSANYPLIKGFSVVGVRAGEYARRDPVRGAENIAQIQTWLEQGKLNPHVGATFPLSRAREAFELMDNRGALGRIVIRPNAD